MARYMLRMERVTREQAWVEVEADTATEAEIKATTRAIRGALDMADQWEEKSCSINIIEGEEVV